MFDERALSIMKYIDATVDSLNAFRPHFLHGYPTFVEALGHDPGMAIGHVVKGLVLLGARELLDKLGVMGVAAGSLFVFHGRHRAVLINYPGAEIWEQAFTARSNA